ncbi:hypothetical protein OUZ56_019750 [Daphnia magna]|uniref:Uncharacterized protein n=1 Tax=Daphnia magna TaxID=35525 RepID=A0ABQ9ZCH5_9CRUS|nr:hypothetical protein OUZ56_019750 [Daphnia magna]
MRKSVGGVLHMASIADLQFPADGSVKGISNAKNNEIVKLGEDYLTKKQMRRSPHLLEVNTNL